MGENENNELKPNSQEIKRNPDGTWSAGQSGNPAGMPPKRYRRVDLQDRASHLLRKYKVKDLSALYRNKALIEDLTIEDAALLQLMKGMVQTGGRKDFEAFMNQLIGKPVQTTELTGKDGENLFNNDDAKATLRSKLVPELAARGKAGSDRETDGS